MLYAALYSGLNTYILTSDQLRDHRFLLGSELADIFKVWQRGHQIMFQGLERRRDGNDKLIFKVRQRDNCIFFWIDLLTFT